MQLKFWEYFHVDWEKRYYFQLGNDPAYYVYQSEEYPNLGYDQVVMTDLHSSAIESTSSYSN